MQIKNVKKSFKNNPVLKDISLEVRSGECIGILGGNGSGKSTLLSILAGILNPDGGSFSYQGIDLMTSKLRPKLVGYVPQSAPLIDELSARDNLSLWYTSDKLKSELSGGVLSLLGIDKFLKTPVCKMSGGMKKRLAIGCSVAHNPKILLLDEPSAALDLICKEKIANYLESFKKSGGIILLATHDLQELPLCDRLFILKNGVLNPFEYDGDVHKLVGSL